MQFPNHRMSEFPCYGKSMRKHKHSKVIGFLYISREAEIHTIPKRWVNEFPYYRISMGKHRQITGTGSRTVVTSKMELFVIIVNGFQPLTIITNRSILDVAAGLDPPQFLLYLTDIEMMKTHAIPDIWECTNSPSMEIFCGKQYRSQAVGF